MQYRNWLNLNLHLLWCHNQPVSQGRDDAGEAILRSTEYANSGAWFVREGWAQVEHGEETHRANPGQWLIVKPGRRIQTFSADARMISIAFDARWPDGSHLFDEGLSLVVEGAEVPILEQKVRPILGIMKKINPDTWDARDHAVDLAMFLNLENRLCEWLAALAGVLEARGIQHSGHTGIDERVRTAINLMHAASIGEAMDTAQLSVRVGLSQNHLIRLFQQDLQTTPMRYWDRLRIEHARLRLLQPETRIKEIALELGFKHLSHFSKWFKQRAGITPRDIRKG